MKLYRIDYAEYLGDGHESPRVAWCGTQKEVALFKKGIKEDDDLNLEHISDVDIPTDKPGLLTWLNTNVGQAI